MTKKVFNMNELPVLIRNEYVLDKEVHVVYPQVYNFHDVFIEKKVNETIKETVHQQLATQGLKEAQYIDMTGTYEVKTNERNVLSLTLINYAFTGGAHGNTLQQGLTFDMETGDIISLEDLFKEGYNYQEILSMLVLEQIKARDIYVLGEYQGISQDQDFYIADKSLIIFFKLYALVPYVYGFPYFPISVYEIQFMIREDSVLGRMLG